MSVVQQFIDDLKVLRRHGSKWPKEQLDDFLLAHLPPLDSPLASMALLWSLFAELPNSTAHILTHSTIDGTQNLQDVLEEVSSVAAFQLCSSSDQEWLQNSILTLSSQVENFEQASLFDLTLIHGQFNAIPLFIQHQKCNPNLFDEEGWNAPLFLAFAVAMRQKTPISQEDVNLALDSLEKVHADFTPATESGATFLTYTIAKELSGVIQWVSQTHPEWLQSSNLSPSIQQAFKGPVERARADVRYFQKNIQSLPESSPLELAFLQCLLSDAPSPNSRKVLRLILNENDELTPLMKEVRSKGVALEPEFAEFDRQKLNETLSPAQGLSKSLRI